MTKLAIYTKEAIKRSPFDDSCKAIVKMLETNGREVELVRVRRRGWWRRLLSRKERDDG